MDLETCLNLDLDLDMADSVSVCVRHYWHQQFETSTGDKTQTGNILPGGETFVPTRWTEAEIKQISRKYQMIPKQIKIDIKSTSFSGLIKCTAEIYFHLTEKEHGVMLIKMH